MTIGENIKLYRKELGLTQKKLGELSGTSETTIKQYELGKRQPRLKQLKKIAQVFGIYVGELLGEHYKEYEEQIIADFIPEIEKAINNATITSNTFYCDSEKIDKINDLFETLNETGQNKAIEQVEMLTKIPEYQKIEEN